MRLVQDEFSDVVWFPDYYKPFGRAKSARSKSKAKENHADE
jgi:hypothetical protein